MEEQALQKTDWFEGLVNDCQGIVTEAIFTSRWTIIEGYHTLGKRISEEKENFNRAEIYGKKIVQCVAESIGKSERSVAYAVQFYEKFPDLQLLPEGKNVSWWKICKKYLPSPHEEEKSENQSSEDRTTTIEQKTGNELKAPNVRVAFNEDVGLWQVTINPDDFDVIDIGHLKYQIEQYLEFSK